MPGTLVMGVCQVRPTLGTKSADIAAVGAVGVAVALAEVGLLDDTDL